MQQGRYRSRTREVRLRSALSPAVILMLLVCWSASYSRTYPVGGSQIPFLNLVQQPNAEIRTLEVGTPIKREADGNVVHLYRVSVVAGQYLRVVVDQQGLDVKVTLFGPDGQQIMQADGPSGANGPEPLSAIAESAGEYRIEVRLPDKKPPAGAYVINLEALRSPIE